MLKRLALVIIFAAVVISAAYSQASAARLVWTASTGQPAGYTVYYHDIAEPATEYRKVLPVTPTEYDVSGLNMAHGKTYSLCLTAFNAAGESGRSNSVQYSVPQYNPAPDVIPPVVIVIPGASVSIRIDP